MEVSGLLHGTVASPPGKEPPIPIGKEAEWTRQPFWTPWRMEKSVDSAANELQPSSPQTVAIPIDVL
jgi:hypothetical protein